MAEITAEDLAALVGAANSLVQTFENKEVAIDQKIVSLSNAVTAALSGDFKSQIIYVDSIAGADANSGASSALALKTFDAAMAQVSPLFSVNEIRLVGDYVYEIGSHLKVPQSTYVFVHGYQGAGTNAVRSGATENRPKITLAHTLVAGDGLGMSGENGIDIGEGAILTFYQCRLEAPQGFEADVDKDFSGYGAKLIRRGTNWGSLGLVLFSCRVDLGLGGLCSVAGPNSSVQLDGVDFYVPVSAANHSTKTIISTPSNSSPLSLYLSNNKFFDKGTALELDAVSRSNSMFYRVAYNSAHGSQPLGLICAVDFSQAALGLV